LNRRFFPII